LGMMKTPSARFVEVGSIIPAATPKPMSHTLLRITVPVVAHG
jgi:hypothetical protein